MLDDGTMLGSSKHVSRFRKFDYTTSAIFFEKERVVFHGLDLKLFILCDDLKDQCVSLIGSSCVNMLASFLYLIQIRIITDHHIIGVLLANQGPELTYVGQSINNAAEGNYSEKVKL